ncbi:UNVERIFIED_CONTAM: Receptor-like protein kinase BRI1-like 3 [Sesamum latifolium]|uniref:non-specific serine/threonine protein kinase n=1 Tax=Sesamum latifolium TaxID=2727402 RepID=A0AAW2WNI7_9LAMI
MGGICGTLEELDLSSNQLTGGLPSNFVSCSSLVSLKLGNNQLSGSFLDTVVSSLTSLKYVSVPFNNITGPVPQSLTNCTQLQVLDLSSNTLTGNVPSEFCSRTLDSVLEKLLLPNNYLSGSVPSELGLCKKLRTIDLSFNNLNGSIPQEIWTLPEISDLVMWANQLRDIGNLVNLGILQLGNNSLSGEIPAGIGKCRSLMWLDLNSNELTGPIPAALAAQSGLIVPQDVSGRHYAFVRSGGRPECRGARWLVEFEGIRPDRLANFPMVHSCPSTTIYTGVIVYSFAGNGSMIYLDLSNNHLSGSIPENLGSMSFLEFLILGHNNITGEIPFSFGGLKSVAVLNLSHNKLQGRIPSGGQLTTFPALTYENNSGLCGDPLPPCESGKAHHASSSSNRGKKQDMAVGMVMCVVAIGMVMYIMAV